MAELFLPVLSHFLNGNPWTGSDGRMRYRIVPDLDDKVEDCTLTAQVWEGPWAYEFSTVEEEKLFPLSEAGLKVLRQWLGDWLEVIAQRPHRTLDEDYARRVAPETDPRIEEVRKAREGQAN